MDLQNLDIIYFVKDSAVNEELRYSLRSVEQNFPHRYVWFIGGKPAGLRPDKYIYVQQNKKTKWDNTSELFKAACINSEISDDFVLFNDDFFVMHPVNNLPYYSDGVLYQKIYKLKAKYGRNSEYSLRLQATKDLLECMNLPTISYAIHYPIIINKVEMLETFGAFPAGLMWRSLYGNYQHKSFQLVQDCKIYLNHVQPDISSNYLSTCDSSFRNGVVGQHIRSRFQEKCKYEVE